MNVSEAKRYTYRQLNVQAKQAFRKIQTSRPDGGNKQDYRYKGWGILVNRGNVSQIMNYDVATAERILKRSIAIVL